MTTTHVSKNLTAPALVEEALAKSELFVRALFERPQSLGALLPYDEYIAESGIFRNKDGSLGAVFEAELLEHETMNADEIVAKVESLKSWLNLPTNCTLQVLYDQSFLSPLDKEWKAVANTYASPHPVSKALLRAKIEQLRGACNSSRRMAPLKRRGLVSIRYYPAIAGMPLGRRLTGRGEAVLFHEMRAYVRESRVFSQILATFQGNSRIPLRQLTASELIDFLRLFFNPKTYYKREFARFNPNLPISDQVLYNNPTLDYSGIEREGVRTRTLSLKTSPQFAYPGGMAYFSQLPFPLKLSLNFKFPTKRQTKTFFDLKEFFLQNTPSAKAKRQREEILEVQDKLARDDRCAHATINLIVEGSTEEELDSRVREVVNVFHNHLDCETVLEEDIGLGLCLNTLPLNYMPQADHSSQRHIRILRSDAVKFLPVFDSFRGMRKPIALHLSREGNLARFSLLENETSNHTVVLADSGSGKSAFVIDCIQSVKRMDPEPLVFVVDKKSSYVMLSEYFDGDLTVFDPGGDMPFSPFRGRYDEEKIAFLIRLLVSGIKLTSPTFELDSTYESAINKALRLAHAKKVRQAGLVYSEGELLQGGGGDEVELTMDDVVTEIGALPAEKDFESFGPTVEELLKRLLPFYGDGTYARYFRGSERRRQKKGCLFYVYDLDALDTDANLQALMTMAVFEEIRRIMRLPENQGRTAFLILEELGMLGRNNPTAGPFILDFAETGRKLGLWLISLTPRPQNYVELEAGRAMWSVADNFLFLQMNGDNVEYLAKHSTLLDEATRQIIKSLRTERGSHADVFFMNKKKTRQGAFRYFQTPLDRWLAPTNARDAREAVKALKRFGARKWQALEYLAEKYPQGVERHEEKVAEERMAHGSESESKGIT